MVSTKTLLATIILYTTSTLFPNYLSVSYYHASNTIQHLPAISTLSNQHIGAIIPLNQLCCWAWRNIYHAIDKGSSTVLISLDLSTAFDTIDHGSVDCKPASAYLDSSLQYSTPILRGTVNICPNWLHHIFCFLLLCALRTFRKDLFLVRCFIHYPSHLLHIVSSHGLLQQQYADDTPLYVAISKDNYDTPVAKLKIYVSTLHTWFYITE